MPLTTCARRAEQGQGSRATERQRDRGTERQREREADRSQKSEVRMLSTDPTVRSQAGGAVAAHGRGSRGEGIVGRVKCVQYGLDDVDDLGCSALHWAALNDRHGVMKMLLQVESNRVESSQS